MHLRTGSNDNFGCQAVNKFLASVIPCGVRFPDKIHGAVGKRLKHVHIHCGYHDYRNRMSGQHLPEKFDSVHFGHFHIHGDDIGRTKRDFFHGLISIGRIAHDLDQLVCLRKAAGEKLAENHGIVHHQDSDCSI